MTVKKSVKKNVKSIHEGQPLRMRGAPLGQATKAMILIHGRGASAEDILQLSDEFKDPQMAYLAPQAADNSWYPNRFLMDTSFNEPWLSSALSTIKEVIRRCGDAEIALENIFLAGFSQGACLALEYAARNPARYGGVFGFSGALIGGEEEVRIPVSGSLSGTPVFMGCSNTDPHIPAVRVRQSSQVMKTLGGAVTVKLYPLMGHTINEDELTIVRSMIGTNRTQSEKAL